MRRVYKLSTGCGNRVHLSTTTGPRWANDEHYVGMVEELPAPGETKQVTAYANRMGMADRRVTLYAGNDDDLYQIFTPATPYDETSIPGEQNWDRCKRMALSIDKDTLIHHLLKALAATMREPKTRDPLWGHVAKHLSQGSCVSQALCQVYGVNDETGQPLTEEST